MFLVRGPGTTLETPFVSYIVGSGDLPDSGLTPVGTPPSVSGPACNAAPVGGDRGCFVFRPAAALFGCWLHTRYSNSTSFQAICLRTCAIHLVSKSKGAQQVIFAW